MLHYPDVTPQVSIIERDPYLDGSVHPPKWENLGRLLPLGNRPRDLATRGGAVLGAKIPNPATGSVTGTGYIIKSRGGTEN